MMVATTLSKANEEQPAADPTTTEEEPVHIDLETCDMSAYMVLPHPCHCELYYTWFQGIFVENGCEPGLLFDRVTHTCTLPEQATCGFGFYNECI